MVLGGGGGSIVEGGSGGGGSEGGGGEGLGVWGPGGGGEGEGGGGVATGSFVSRLQYVQYSLFEYLTVAQSCSLTRHQPQAERGGENLGSLQDSSAWLSSYEFSHVSWHSHGGGVT